MAHAASPAVSVYTLDEQRVFVVVPPTMTGKSTGTSASTAVDILVYYHGLHGYYRRAGKNNALTSVDLPAAIAAADRPVIAILPEAKRGDADRSRAWQRLVTKEGGFQRLIDQSLAHVQSTYGQAGLTPRRIAIAAHSGGGAMVGPSVAPRGGRYGALVDEVTLMDAGYPYKRAFNQLKTWLLDGDKPRTLRILHGGSAQAAYAVGLFSRDNDQTPRHRSLRRYPGIRPDATARKLKLTAAELGAFKLDSLTFEVIELTRGADAAGVAVEWGAAESKGHYAIRDVSLGPAVLAVGTEAPRWSLVPAAAATAPATRSPDARELPGR